MIEIREGGLDHPGVVQMLEAHVAALRAVSPPESCHVLNLEGLRQADVAFFTAWRDGALAGCGALKTLSATHGEVKSMRTADGHQRQGVAAAVLTHLLQVARARGLSRVSLETGPTDYFAPARTLYARFGFAVCGPFEGYVADPNSVFMTLALSSSP